MQVKLLILISLDLPVAVVFDNGIGILGWLVALVQHRRVPMVSGRTREGLFKSLRGFLKEFGHFIAREIFRCFFAPNGYLYCLFFF